MEQTSSSRIYVDLDDVLAETGRAFLEVLAREFGKRIEFEDIVDYDLGKSLDLEPEILAEFMRAVHRPRVLGGLSPIRGAIETVGDWVSRGYEVDVVTGRPEQTAEVSRGWLEAHRVPHRRLAFVDKYAWPGEVFQASEGTGLHELVGSGYRLAVEDSADVAERLAGLLEVPVVLLDRPWNRRLLEGSAEANGRIVRCRDWHEIRERFPAP